MAPASGLVSVTPCCLYLLLVFFIFSSSVNSESCDPSTRVFVQDHEELWAPMNTARPCDMCAVGRQGVGLLSVLRLMT